MNKNQKKFSMEFILSTTSHTSSISTHAQFLLALYYKTTRHSTTEYYGQNGFTGRDIQKGKSINLEMSDTEEVTKKRESLRHIFSGTFQNFCISTKRL